MVEEADDFFVTAILVTHDGATWLPEVIAALSSQSRPIDRIVAVDTGSVDTSMKLLKSAGVNAYLEDRDMGYGDAIEHALALTPTSGPGEFLWFIHDDCAPDRNALALLLDALADRPQTAIAGPKLRSWYDRDRLLEVGVSIASNGNRWTGLESNEQDQGQYDGIHDVMAVSTAAMLVRRNIFEDLGGLDINLALFRDDVDLAWRARMAGFSAICVANAVAYHAEASASERRAVDVSEAFLHRPLLLDRRNAAYVMLVNSSFWLLPFVALQLFVTSLARAAINLLAKLPGYAGDEIAAVGLLIINPQEIFIARRNRKKKRLLSPRIVAEYIPSTWSQLRLAFERTGSAIMDRLTPDRLAAPDEESEMTYSDIGTLPDNFSDNFSDNFDEADITPLPSKASFLKLITRKPQFLIATAIAVVSIFASRLRLGALSGGALAGAPAGGFELLQRYVESWHLVGLGSAAQMPPWIALLGVSSALTFGKLSLLITLIFLLAPAVSYLAMYRVLLRQGVSRNLGLLGAGIYAAAPLLWGAINQGRLGTLLVIQLAPTLLALNPFDSKMESSTWRRIFAISLLAGVISAFSPLLLAIWLLVQLVLFGSVLFSKRLIFQELGWAKFLFSDQPDGAKRRLALLVTPWLLTFPWSASLLLHPSQFLLEPGIPQAAGQRWDVLLFNPGGISAPPLWLISPFILFFIASFYFQELRKSALIVSGLLGLAIVLSALQINGHGSAGRVWCGPLITIAELYLLGPILLVAQKLIPTLRESRFGVGHIGVAIMTVVSLLSIAAMPVWAVTVGDQSLVRAEQKPVVPAFLGALEQTPSKPKTIVVRINSQSTSYAITRGSDLKLGEADVSVSPPPEISLAVDALFAGTGITSSRILGGFGIQYLYLQNPVPIAAARIIDGIGGYARMSATDAGILWKVVGSAPRILFSDSTYQLQTIASLSVGASGVVPSAGTVSVAEKYDTGWTLLLNGQPIPLHKSAAGLPAFDVPTAGSIVLSHDGTKRRALISIQFIALICVVVLALPAGRRRLDVALAEESA